MLNVGCRLTHAYTRSTENKSHLNIALNYVADATPAVAGERPRLERRARGRRDDAAALGVALQRPLHGPVDHRPRLQVPALFAYLPGVLFILRSCAGDVGSVKLMGGIPI